MNSPRETLPDGHAVDLVQDYLHGRLDAATNATLRAHLASCDECAADFAFALSLRDVDSGEEDLAAFLDELPEPQLERAKRRPRTPAPQPLRWAVSLFAVAAALVLFFNPFGSQHSSLEGFARLEPLPVRVVRDAAEPGSFDEARQTALSAYGEGNYEIAIEACRSALRLRPESGEMRIYEASALALSGQLEESVSVLDELLRAGNGADPVVREARWQRAQIALAQNDEDVARRQLEILYAEDGLRQGDAEQLLRKLAEEN